MRSIFIRGILAATAALVAACSSTDSVAPTNSLATARRDVTPGGVSVNSGSLPVDTYVWVSCTNGGVGEVLRVTGELHFESERMQDASGVFHYSFKSATSGLTAVGLTTGTVFRGLMTERTTSRAEDYLNADIRLNDIIRFVASGSGDSYSLMVSSHIIIDQGSYVLWDDTWNEVCR
jgi:hypothetical protein